MEFNPDAYEEVIIAGTQAFNLYDGFDLSFESIDQYADEVGECITGRKFYNTRGNFGTVANVKHDIRCLTRFAVARSLLETLYVTHHIHTRVTSAVCNTKLIAPSPIVKYANKVGSFVNQDKKYSPRDVGRLAVKCLFGAFSEAPNSRTFAYNNETTGNFNDVDFNLLDFSPSGDIVSTRDMPLQARLRAFARDLLDDPDPERFTLAQRVLECSDLSMLRRCENIAVARNWYTRAQVAALYPRTPDPVTNDHQIAVRNITGDSNFNAATGNTVAIKNLRERISNVQAIFRKIEVDFTSIVKLMPLNTHDCGDVSQIAGFDLEDETVSSICQQAVSGIANAVVTRLGVNNFGTHRSALDAIGDSIRNAAIRAEVEK